MLEANSFDEGIRKCVEALRISADSIISQCRKLEETSDLLREHPDFLDTFSREEIRELNRLEKKLLLISEAAAIAKDAACPENFRCFTEISIGLEKIGEEANIASDFFAGALKKTGNRGTKVLFWIAMPYDAIYNVVKSFYYRTKGRKEERKNKNLLEKLKEMSKSRREG